MPRQGGYSEFPRGLATRRRKPENSNTRTIEPLTTGASTLRRLSRFVDFPFRLFGVLRAPAASDWRAPPSSNERTRGKESSKALQVAAITSRPDIKSTAPPGLFLFILILLCFVRLGPWDFSFPNSSSAAVVSKLDRSSSLLLLNLHTTIFRNGLRPSLQPQAAHRGSCSRCPRSLNHCSPSRSGEALLPQ